MLKGMTFVIVSGLSGSGKSTAMRALEHSDCFVVDNLPPCMWSSLHEEGARRGVKRIAVSCDARTRAFLGGLDEQLEAVRALAGDVRIVFLEAGHEVLLRRYNFTRREHPLGENLMADFLQERQMLVDLRMRADVVIDTSALDERALAARVLEFASVQQRFGLRLMSFGFKHAPPRDADLVLDVRSMPNPYYEDDLREKTGKSPEVAAHVFGNAKAEAFYLQLRDFVESVASRAEQDGRHGYSVAIGCTGGQHRSVAVVERLATELRQLSPKIIAHRDIPSLGEEE